MRKHINIDINIDQTRNKVILRSTMLGKVTTKTTTNTLHGQHYDTSLIKQLFFVSLQSVTFKAFPFTLRSVDILHLNYEGQMCATISPSETVVFFSQGTDEEDSCSAETPARGKIFSFPRSKLAFRSSFLPPVDQPSLGRLALVRLGYINTGLAAPPWGTAAHWLAAYTTYDRYDAAKQNTRIRKT